jgi:pimeloyl-ACP methyl ester carboxylesterase
VRTVEGRIPFHGYETWYRDVRGSEDGAALLCLHGGPGSTHHYFEPLERLADDGRRVVLYDQLGCGSSDRPDDPDLWTLELFLNELQAVRNALGLERIHLLGTSWGSMLAMEYVLQKPEGLVSLTLNSPPTATATWAAEAGRLRAPLAEEEAVAEEEFWRRHICRLEPWPDCIRRGREEKGKQVYETLWGTSEWNPDGRLRDWDIRPRLAEIDAPTLITSGRYDECTPELAEVAHRGIRGSEWVLFEESSHTAFVEEPERFGAVVSGFFDRAEAA